MRRIEIRRRPRREVPFAFALGLFLTAACKKLPAPSAAKSPAAAVDLSVPMSPRASSPETGAGSEETSESKHDRDMRRMIEERYASDPVKKEAMLRDLAISKVTDRQSDIDRKIFVVPAAADYRPGKRARELRVTLSLETTVIRKGEQPRFRVEIQNLGRERFSILDGGDGLFSLFKLGDISGCMDIQFHLIMPDGKDETLNELLTESSGVYGDEIKTPPGLSPQETKRWVQQQVYQSIANEKLYAYLDPGETLRMQGAAPGNPYFSLDSDEDFHLPGTYRLKILFDDRPRPMNQTFINAGRRAGLDIAAARAIDQKLLKTAWGPIYSNTVTFKVAP